MFDFCDNQANRLHVIWLAFLVCKRQSGNKDDWSIIQMISNGLPDVLDALRESIEQRKIGPILALIDDHDIVTDDYKTSGNVKHVLERYYHDTRKIHKVSQHANATILRASTYQSFIDQKYYNEATKKVLYVWPLRCF